VSQFLQVQHLAPPSWFIRHSDAVYRTLASDGCGSTAPARGAGNL